jgi:hypothetical protein
MLHAPDPLDAGFDRQVVDIAGVGDLDTVVWDGLATGHSELLRSRIALSLSK